MGQNPTYTKENGAKKGLKMKMDYWKDKDYQYEYGVTLGAAINNLLVMQPKVLEEGLPIFLNELTKMFEASLVAKSDQKLQAMFDAYYRDKKKGLEGDVAVEVE